jgi:hypothetical protein
MTEGARDAYFGEHGVPDAPRPLEEQAFGKPECFVPQRVRVTTQLKMVGGFARVIVRLADPRRWLRLVSP